ncbi:hypothetical protein ElyMa_004648400 [Elysia marginata]|uniref:CUB domain-containing protein n=1 Tax=Elysia marginata TaxID=1093978 RepID=A0AAV4I0T1_9GAST|nr:hypothetical protein ElyMa_004648400 [Elysia marginata]
MAAPRPYTFPLQANTHHSKFNSRFRVLQHGCMLGALILTFHKCKALPLASTHFTGMYLERKRIPYSVKVKENTTESKGKQYILKLGRRNVNICSYKPAFVDCGEVIQLNASSAPYTFRFSNNKTYAQCGWLIKVSGNKDLRLALEFDDLNIEPVKKDHTCSLYSRNVNELEVRYQEVGEPGIRYNNCFKYSV